MSTRKTTSASLTEIWSGKAWFFIGVAVVRHQLCSHFVLLFLFHLLDNSLFLNAIKQLDHIKSSAPVGLLTCDHRDAWTKAREHLVVLDPKNRESLQTIENALFCVTLDSAAEATKADRANDFAEWAKFGMHGHGGHNRWCDKSMNLIFERDGKFVCHGEVKGDMEKKIPLKPIPLSTGSSGLSCRTNVWSETMANDQAFLSQIALPMRRSYPCLDHGHHHSQTNGH